MTLPVCVVTAWAHESSFNMELSACVFMDWVHESSLKMKVALFCLCIYRSDTLIIIEE